MKILFSKKGFTLTELLVYIAILTIIILAISSFLLWTIRSNNKAKAMRETLDGARRVMEIIAYETKEAKAVYAPTTTSTQLSLETTHYLPDEEETTYIDLYLCDTQICLKKESQSPIVLSLDNIEVKTLSFTQIATTSNRPSIQVNLTMDYKSSPTVPAYQASVNLISTISLRNP